MNTQRNKSLDMMYIALGAVFITISSWITIPLTVPVTLQTCGIFIIIGMLGGRRGTLSVLIYLFLGIIGFPVFSGFRGGIGILFGNTGGYIIGFVFTALFLWLFEKNIAASTMRRFLAMIAGQVICYLFGTLWFWFLYAKEATQAGIGLILGWCVIPFLIPDVCKIIIALVVCNKTKGLIK